MDKLRRLHVFTLLWTGLALAGCDAEQERGAMAPQARVDAPVSFDHRFPIEVGDKTVRMRLAILPHEQKRGLMQVKAMPEDEGMLFLYDSGRQMSFWMRNTFIPLDIGFFDDAGILIEVHQMFPHIEDPVASLSNSLHFALEMNQGWFARNGIRAGAKLDLSSLAEAIERRGLDAEKFVDRS